MAPLDITLAALLQAVPATHGLTTIMMLPGSLVAAFRHCLSQRCDLPELPQMILSDADLASGKADAIIDSLRANSPLLVRALSGALLEGRDVGEGERKTVAAP